MLESVKIDRHITETVVERPSIHKERLHLCLNLFMTDIYKYKTEFMRREWELGNYHEPNRIAMNMKLFELIRNEILCKCHSDYSINYEEISRYEKLLIEDYNKQEITLCGMKVVIRDDFADDEIDIYQELSLFY